MQSEDWYLNNMQSRRSDEYTCTEMYVHVHVCATEINYFMKGNMFLLVIISHNWL